MKTTLFALVSTSVSIAAFGFACDRTPGASAAPNSPAAPASSSVESEKYTLELKPVGKYEKGKAATFEIVLKTRGDFHVNEDYPTKFKAAKADGVKYDLEVLHKMKNAEAFTMEGCASGKDKCTLKITVKFTPEASGKVSLGGELQVGVCNKETCLVEKKTLDLSVPVT
ncbi:MAG: hypothetical protein ACXWUG_31165 [Polyangiales bacterium]